jgi:crotonobetainyl-CoA:carnitine CoA-transferase CaiB-like acyl-CoA transferase
MIQAIAELCGFRCNADASDLGSDQQLTCAHAALHAQLRDRREGVGEYVNVALAGGGFRV